jgi:hypothetical protein
LQLKLSSLINLAIFNVIALILADLVYSDRVWRVGYWENVLGFTPHTAYYPFFYVTSAVRGSTSIPGTLTVDWLQVILVIMVLVDGSFALAYFRRRRASPPVPQMGAQTA